MRHYKKKQQKKGIYGRGMSREALMRHPSRASSLSQRQPRTPHSSSSSTCAKDVDISPQSAHPASRCVTRITSPPPHATLSLSLAHQDLPRVEHGGRGGGGRGKVHVFFWAFVDMHREGGEWSGGGGEGTRGRGPEPPVGSMVSDKLSLSLSHSVSLTSTRMLLTRVRIARGAAYMHRFRPAVAKSQPVHNVKHKK